MNKDNSTTDLPSRDASALAAPDPLWRTLSESAAARASDVPDGGSALVLDRRQWLKLMSASFALAGLGGCGKPPGKNILPFVQAPEFETQGETRHYATAALLDGYAIPVVATSFMGRPLKLEGNPRHPASGGATDIFAQAAVLQLWDPDRSSLLLRDGKTTTWKAFLAELERWRPRWHGAHGGRLRLLTGTVTSPTLAAQLHALQRQLPDSRWHQYQPVNTDLAHAGARLAFDETVEPHWHLAQAERILALDCDFLGPGPGQVAQASAFIGGRVPRDGTMNRLYVLEPSPTLTGAIADHRWALSPAQIQAWAYALAQTLGAVLPEPALDATARRQVQALSADLQAHRGRCLVMAGRTQPPAVHALVHWINAQLGNPGHTLTYHAPVQARVEDQMQSLRTLVEDMRAGRVDALIVLGGNPVYDAPADLGFTDALQQVPLSVHHGLYRDETAVRCHWHLPLAHPLERWGDARASDGHVSILQPLIAPLYNGRSPHALLQALSGNAMTEPREQVRSHWRDEWGEGDFEARWETALRDGVLPGSASPQRQPSLRPDLIDRLPAAPADEGLILALAPDATVWDGQFANNAWLQELPKPMTQLTWDNAALISPRLAGQAGLASGDQVELSLGGRRLVTAVWVTPGQADAVVTLSLGYGRRHAGQVGTGCGFDANQLRISDAPWTSGPVALRRLATRYPLATTQAHHDMEGRDLVRRADLVTYRNDPQRITGPRQPPPSLYPPYPYPGHAWGMFVDLNACIGCSACTIACQAENNIPVVGKDEVRRGREMHWIRVDRYYEGPSHNPRTYFQPVPCMHCEHAPCELVCPVGATVHDGEGLNLQVYNRCIGTRFCSNNCPYKVRRFNFLQYADRTSPALAAQRNPEVTVRQRGVMEKCTYCIQRIEQTRIRAAREDRTVGGNEVVTACQQACPTTAIVFGDINNPDSAVSRAKASPLEYALLAELNTRPRTTYGARLRNPNPDLPAGLEDPA